MSSKALFISQNACHMASKKEEKSRGKKSDNMYMYNVHVHVRGHFRGHAETRIHNDAVKSALCQTSPVV